MFGKNNKNVNKDGEKKNKYFSLFLKNKKTIFVVVLGFIIGILIGCLIGQQLTRINQLTKTEIADELKSLIRDNLVDAGQNLELVKVEEVSGLYKISFELDDSPMNFYMTKDGKLLIFEGGVKNFAEFKSEIEAVEERNREEREWREKSDQFQAALTPERKVKIAQCLTEKGFEVYVADWCPFCRQQKELFGEAAKYLTSIDCFDPDGTERNIAKCPNIEGVPAWKDGEGNMLQGGMLCIKRLVKLSGCNY